MDARVKIDQERRVFEAFRTPKTMKMVAEETGIDRANICWYVSHLRKRNAVKPVRQGLCRITKHRATYLTTNLGYDAE